jgi:N-acetylmuramic acid 6-phosphate etherase
VAAEVRSAPDAGGLTGLGELLTEQVNPASSNFDTLPTAEMLAIFNAEDERAVAAVQTEIPHIAAAVDAAADVLARGGRLFYIGAGTSGRLAVLDASECPPTFNVPESLVVAIVAGGDAALRHASEGGEDSAASGAADLVAAGFTARDVLVGIAASGRTPYVLGAVQQARTLGALTVGISCSPHSPLSQSVAIAIEPLPGPEVIAGSTRLKAGTATKLVLNMLSTGVMVRLGHVYSNLMVNVQPKNEKLVDRAQRIIMAVTGTGREEAALLLEAAGRNVRTAIVMGKLGVTREAAERLLERAGGRLRQAIQPD